MQTTANLGLKKPDGTDVVNIQDFNDNADLLDVAVATKETSAGAQAKANTAEANAKAYADTKVAGLVNSSPAALDTLKELADALGSDPNYAATTATLIGTKAPLASPAFTGTPSAPTAAVDTNTIQVATTAFVLGQAGTTTPVMDGTAGVGTSKRYARADHVHPVDSSRAAQVDFAAHLADYVSQPANGGTTAGTSTAYTCTSLPAPTALVDKIGVVITAHVDSGANPTLNWSSKGTKSLKKPNGNAAVLKAGGIYTFRYSAASGNFILQGEGASGNATESDLLSGKTASTDAGDITGTMPSRAYQQAAVGSWADGAGTLALKMPTGAYITEGAFGVGYCAPTIVDADFIAGNIVSGKDIFGVAGTFDKIYGVGDIITQSKISADMESGRNTSGQFLHTATDSAGNMYAAMLGGGLYKFDSAGTVIWSKTDYVSGSIGCDNNGYIYQVIGNGGTRVRKIDSSGTVVWTSAALGMTNLNCLRVTPDGTKAYGFYNNAVYQITIGGGVVWTNTATITVRSLAVDMGYNVVVGHENAPGVINLRKLNYTGGGVLWSVTNVPYVYGVAVDPSNNIWVQYYSQTAAVYAKCNGSNGAIVVIVNDITDGYPHSSNCCCDSKGNAYLGYSSNSGNVGFRKVDTSGVELWRISPSASYGGIFMAGSPHIFILNDNDMDGTMGIRCVYDEIQYTVLS